LRKLQEKSNGQNTQLVNDVAGLRKAIAEEHNERSTKFKDLEDSLANESRQRKSELQSFIREATEKLDSRTLVDDFEALRLHVAQLESDQNVEKDAWRLKVKELEKIIEANSVGDNVFAQEVKRQLKDHQKQLHENALQDDEFKNTIIPRLQMAGQIMEAAGRFMPCAPEGAKSVGRWSPETPDSALSRPGTASTPLPERIVRLAPG
jgi:hypothetical protein